MVASKERFLNHLQKEYLFTVSSLKELDGINLDNISKNLKEKTSKTFTSNSLLFK